MSNNKTKFESEAAFLSFLADENNPKYYEAADAIEDHRLSMQATDDLDSEIKRDYKAAFKDAGGKSVEKDLFIANKQRGTNGTGRLVTTATMKVKGRPLAATLRKERALETEAVPAHRILKRAQSDGSLDREIKKRKRLSLSEREVEKDLKETQRRHVKAEGAYLDMKSPDRMSAKDKAKKAARVSEGKETHWTRATYDEVELTEYDD